MNYKKAVLEEKIVPVLVRDSKNQEYLVLTGDANEIKKLKKNKKEYHKFMNWAEDICLLATKMGMVTPDYIEQSLMLYLSNDDIPKMRED